MKTLKTQRLKPNPLGKDRSRFTGATAAQLGAEWVDIQNYGQRPVEVTGISLKHIAYSPDGRATRWEEVLTFKGTLPPGQVVRVHSGSGPASVLRPEDLAGADFHLFSGGNYVWNNDRGDSAGLFEAPATPFDKASYAPNPPEGVVLTRIGDHLVASTSVAGAASGR